MKKGRRFNKLAWWSIILLAIVLAAIGLIIAVIVSDRDAGPQPAPMQVEDHPKLHSQGTSKDHAKTKTKTPSKNVANTSVKPRVKKQEPAVVTRCKSARYMETQLKGSSEIDCDTAAGIERFQSTEISASLPASNGQAQPQSTKTSRRPNRTKSKSRQAVGASSKPMPASGPSNHLPAIFILSFAVYASAFGLNKLCARKLKAQS